MPHYRIYPLSSAGRVGVPLDADCADDASAICAARDLHGALENGCEIWELTRFLGRFHFPAAPATPAVPADLAADLAAPLGR